MESRGSWDRGTGGDKSLRAAQQLDGSARWRRLIGVCPPCARVAGGAICPDIGYRRKKHLLGMWRQVEARCVESSAVGHPDQTPPHGWMERFNTQGEC